MEMNLEMKTIEDVYVSYNNGDYNSKLGYPKAMRLPENHIFDENQSVKWNREKVQEHNDRIVKEKEAYNEDSNRLAAQLRADAVEALQNEYDLTKKQAELVEAYAYQEKHSYMGDYINSFYDLGPLARKLINTTK